MLQENDAPNCLLCGSPMKRFEGKNPGRVKFQCLGSPEWKHRVNVYIEDERLALEPARSPVSTIKNLLNRARQIGGKGE